ncbi:response regulator transcription factor [Alkaliphilus crotonatoxidans]
MVKILVIEDEVKIARFLQLELEHEGYEVIVAHDGPSGLEAALRGDCDLILLDLMLPGLSGMEVCRRIRAASEVPIMMLTAKDQTMDKVIGLDSGADDYITKPFAIEELLARIRVILKRRSYGKNTDVLKLNGLTIDRKQHVVTYEGDRIELTKREFDLLTYLMENVNIVLSRDQILETVWGYDYLGDTNVVDVYIRYLRSKIDEQYHIKLIHTVRGVGYLVKDEATNRY